MFYLFIYFLCKHCCEYPNLLGNFSAIDGSLIKKLLQLLLVANSYKVYTQFIIIFTPFCSLWLSCFAICGKSHMQIWICHELSYVSGFALYRVNIQHLIQTSFLNSCIYVSGQTLIFGLTHQLFLGQNPREVWSARFCGQELGAHVFVVKNLEHTF